MKKLIAIVVSLIFMFEGTGYCLRPPMGEHKRLEDAMDKDLLDNPWMRSLCARRGEVDDRKNFSIFLKRDHSLKIEIFSEIDDLLDDEILRMADECLATVATEGNNYLGFGSHSFNHYLNRHLNLRELFLYPTAGGLDLSQALLTGLLYYVDPNSINGGLERRGRPFIKIRLKNYYLIIKAMEILSRKADLVLVQEQDIDALVAYLKGESHAEQTLRNLLSLADLLMPCYTPQKQEALHNLIILLDRLKQESQEFGVGLSQDRNQLKVQKMRNALSEAVLSPVEIADEAASSL